MSRVKLLSLSAHLVSLPDSRSSQWASLGSRGQITSYKLIKTQEKDKGLIYNFYGAYALQVQPRVCPSLAPSLGQTLTQSR